MPDYHIAFWNVENLFDIEGSPRRTEKLQRALGSSIVGWTQALLDRKVSQLSSIIRQLNNNSGPDILGVCEVENDHVLADRRGYVVHNTVTRSDLVKLSWI